MKYGDLLVFERDQDKEIFKFYRMLPGGFIQSIARSGSYWLAHGKFITGVFHQDECRPATDEEAKEYLELLNNSSFK